MSTPPSPPPYSDTSLSFPSDVKDPFLSPPPSFDETSAFLLSLLHSPLLLLALDPAVLSVTQSPDDPSLYFIRDSVTRFYVFTWQVRITLLPDGIQMDGGPGPGVLSTRFRYKVDKKILEHNMGEQPRSICRFAVEVDAVPTWFGMGLGVGTLVWKNEIAATLLKRFVEKSFERSGGKLKVSPLP